ncbi:uncharacterized protein LOC133838663 [Drosophila sulfurigaster albostrigata]|uniref:uncharacterized protein LOC133838663 n=1 Tax=Drosophila sulfurigaster albostrigata TaxID=89887 RepID=UPI002D21B4DF|nr:uncharacterized protein LOC133838663 [Drosophila sulfurigaster albostrigata]
MLINSFNTNFNQVLKVELSALTNEFQQLKTNFFAKVKDCALCEKKVADLEMKLQKSAKLNFKMEQKLAQAEASYIKMQQFESIIVASYDRSIAHHKQSQISQECDRQQFLDNINREAAKDNDEVLWESLLEENKAKTNGTQQQKMQPVDTMEIDAASDDSIRNTAITTGPSSSSSTAPAATAKSVDEFNLKKSVD